MTRTDPSLRLDRDGSPDPAAAWGLTGLISPRQTVRLAAVDAAGAVLNAYPSTTSTTGAPPDVPWAVFLADRHGDFRLLCFDLDASHGDPAADAATLGGWLDAAGISWLLTESGPSGGRHVWIATTAGIPADTVRALARMAAMQLPTLDVSALSNPATGCVRPPGAPHRNGGHSKVIAGDIGALLNPTTTPAAVDLFLTGLLSRLGSDITPGPDDVIDDVAILPLDTGGHRYLPGPRRAIPAASAAALNRYPDPGQGHALSWTVLCGLATARHHHSDALALVEAGHPGLEHLRTENRGPTRPRRPRTRTETATMLARQWDRAVRWTAAHPRTTGDDPTFPLRAAAVVDLVDHTQSRADATTGRWTSTAGPNHRRILDALCLLTLQAVSAHVEADTRRLALMCGVGRETARTSLLRLQEDGWITQYSPATGPHGARWALTTPASTTAVTSSRSQAVPPPGVGPLVRRHWIDQLARRLRDVAHDVFVHPGGLGSASAAVYVHLTAEPRGIDDLARATGYTALQLVPLLHDLVDHQLVLVDGLAWSRPGDDHRDTAAQLRRTTGRLADRAVRYALERQLWAWWLDELDWMRTPRHGDTTRQPGVGQLPLATAEPLPPARLPHPRRGGRADYRAARVHLTAAPKPPPRVRRRAA